MENPIHRRFITGSKLFYDELIRLGFKEQDSRGHGLSKIRIFKKDNKIVETGYDYMTLRRTDIIGKGNIVHRGYSVHDELLEFFATRNPIEIKDGKKEK